MALLIKLTLAAYLFALGILVLFRSKKEYTRAFTLFCFGAASWSISAQVFSEGLLLPTFFARAAFASMILTLAALIEFSYTFPFKIEESKAFKPISWFVSIPMFILAMSKGIVEYAVEEDGIMNAHYGSLYPIFFVYVFVALSVIFVFFFNKYRASSHQDKLQLKYFLTGLSITTVFLLFTNLLIPALTGSSYTSQFGPLGLIPIVTFLSLAVLRQRLFDLKLIIGRGILYMLLGLYVFANFYLFSWLYRTFFGGIYTPVSYSFGVVASVLIGVSIVYLHNRLKELILQDIFHTKYDLYEISKEFSEKINYLLEMDPLCEEIMSGFKKIFDVERTGIIILDKKTSEAHFQKFDGYNINEKDVQSIFRVLDIWKNEEHGAILIREDLEDEISVRENAITKDVLRLMVKMNAAAILPLNRKVALNGIFIIGEKKTQEPFTVEDINLMESLIGYSSVAIGRSILYDEVSDFNLKLKSEVKSATKDLAEANKELTQLDKMKDDLISIASHELRTPAAIVKGKLYLLKTRIEKVKECKYYDTKIEEDIDVCISAIEREIEQVNTLLEASRVGKDTMVLELQEYDLAEIVKESVEDFQIMAKEKGLMLKLGSVEKDLPTLEFDVKRIREVIDNLITNSIKYTESGGITVEIYLGEDGLCTSVKDTGIGIPQEEINKLFSKFYRVKNAQRTGKLTKPGGTGLGLFVAKNIVEKHDGKIWVESQEGKGSVFTFCIPVKKKK